MHTRRFGIRALCPSGILLALSLFLVSVPLAFAQPHARTLSVLYFTNTTNDSSATWLSKGLADMLVSDLGASAAFSVVEREELQKILQEQELALSGLVDEHDAPRIGRLLGADLLVYGSYIATGTTLRYDAKAVVVESATLASTASVTGSLDQALHMERQLAQKLAAGLGVTLADSGFGTSSIEAAASYYRGIDALDAGRYDEAVGLFGRASQEDPTFLKPGKGLEDAYRYLKDFRKQRYQREINNLVADISDLTSRISAPVFYSFADVVRDPTRFGFKDAEAASSFYRTRPNVLNGNTPVEATWFLQYLYRDLAQKATDYFADQATSDRCRQKILDVASAAQRAYPKDQFLPELIYQKLLVFRDTSNWTQARDTCEEIMAAYPDYRMISSVEDFYAEALDKLRASR